MLPQLTELARYVCCQYMLIYNIMIIKELYLVRYGETVN